MPDDWAIEQLEDGHDRSGFCCSNSSLDDFIKTYASQYERRGIGRTYVAVRQGENRVIGYFTLAASALAFQILPPKIGKKLAKHPVPVVHLGRLAVDQSAPGQGLGAYLLLDALKRCWHLSRRLGLFAVDVRAIDDKAKAFYLRYGFVSLVDDERHLFLPMKTIETLFVEKET